MKKKTLLAVVFLFSIIGIAGAIRAEVIQSWCASNTTLTVVRSDFVYNGTQWANVITTTNITCNANITCNNNSFSGPACDPPLLQQPLFLAGYGILGIIVLAGIVYILKRVL